MNSHNASLKADAEIRRAQIRKLRAKVPKWTWARIAKKYGVSVQRAQQLGK